MLNLLMIVDMLIIFYMYDVEFVTVISIALLQVKVKKKKVSKPRSIEVLCTYSQICGELCFANLKLLYMYTLNIFYMCKLL